MPRHPTFDALQMNNVTRATLPNIPPLQVCSKSEASATLFPEGQATEGALHITLKTGAKHRPNFGILGKHLQVP